MHKYNTGATFILSILSLVILTFPQAAHAQATLPAQGTARFAPSPFALETTYPTAFADTNIPPFFDQDNSDLLALLTQNDTQSAPDEDTPFTYPDESYAAFNDPSSPDATLPTNIAECESCLAAKPHPDHLHTHQPTGKEIKALIDDSNPEFPLTRVNAAIALTGPFGTTSLKIAGPGVKGPDITFYIDGEPFFYREVKCLTSGNQTTFNKRINYAADQLHTYGNTGGDIFLQMDVDQRSAQRILADFRRSTPSRPKSYYEHISVTIYDPYGSFLTSEPI